MLKKKKALAPEPASAPAPEPSAPEPAQAPAVALAPDPILAGFATQPELAVELGVTPRTVQRWESMGDAPPSVKLGLHRYYNRERAKVWLAARESKSKKRGAR
jgi:hypothetical protein